MQRLATARKRFNKRKYGTMRKYGTIKESLVRIASFLNSTLSANWYYVTGSQKTHLYEIARAQVVAPLAEMLGQKYANVLWGRIKVYGRQLVDGTIKKEIKEEGEEEGEIKSLESLKSEVVVIIQREMQRLANARKEFNEQKYGTIKESLVKIASFLNSTLSANWYYVAKSTKDSPIGIARAQAVAPLAEMRGQEYANVLWGRIKVYGRQLVEGTIKKEIKEEGEEEEEEGKIKSPESLKSEADLQEYSSKFENEKWVIRKNSDFWLGDLPSINIKLSNKAKLVNIYDDIDYQVNENKLQISDRKELANFRATVLRKYIPLAEVSQICRLIAPWDLNKKISVLNLPVRVSSRLIQMNIYHVFELAEISNARLSTPGFGASSLGELKNCLFKLIEDIPNFYKEYKNIKVFINSIVESLEDREKLILVSRLGLEGEYKTLEEIGENFSVSRERIRQIEKKLGILIDKIFNARQLLSSKLDKLLDNRFIPLKITTIKNYDNWFDGIDEKPWLLGRLLTFLNISEFSVSDYKNLAILHRGPKEFIDDTIKDLFEWADKNKKSKLTLTAIRDHVYAITNFVAPELFDLILTEVIEKMKFAKIGDDQVLIAIGNSLNTRVMGITEQSSVPLNIIDIQRLINEESVNSSERYIRAECARSLLLFGPSLYGLRKHLNINDAEILTIANTVEGIVRDNNFPRQWHCDKAMEILEKNNFIFLSRINKYKLSLCLQLSNKFEFLGRLTFTSRSDDKDSKQKRLEFFPMVEFILEQSEIPLNLKIILKLIEKERGLGAYSQITNRGRLVSFKGGIWGLIDKHANVSKEDFDTIINELTGIFLEKKKGISENEMLSYITPNMYINRFKSKIYLLYSLVQRSDLFKRDREFLYLLEIDAPKRLSKAEILGAIIIKIGDSFRVEDLYKQASELYGEEIFYERGDLASTVAKYNYVFDRKKMLYKKDSGVN